MVNIITNINMIDFNLSEGSPLLNNDISLILQQVDLLFSTTPREVLGDEEFGTQYDKYLYNLQLSGDNLKQIAYRDISSLELFGFTPEVEVYLLQGTEQDIAIIEITLTRQEEVYKKTYKIS